MGKQRLTTGDGREGVDVTYVKRGRRITLGGWYDGMVGMEPCTFTLGEFLTTLGITVDDCRKALGGQDGN